MKIRREDFNQKTIDRIVKRVISHAENYMLPAEDIIEIVYEEYIRQVMITGTFVYYPEQANPERSLYTTVKDRFGRRTFMENP